MEELAGVGHIVSVGDVVPLAEPIVAMWRSLPKVLSRPSSESRPSRSRSTLRSGHSLLSRSLEASQQSVADRVSTIRLCRWVHRRPNQATTVVFDGRLIRPRARRSKSGGGRNFLVRDGRALGKDMPTLQVLHPASTVVCDPRASKVTTESRVPHCCARAARAPSPPPGVKAWSLRAFHFDLSAARGLLVTGRSTAFVALLSHPTPFMIGPLSKNFLQFAHRGGKQDPEVSVSVQRADSGSHAFGGSGHESYRRLRQSAALDVVGADTESGV